MTESEILQLRSCDFCADRCFDENCDYCNTGRAEGARERARQAALADKDTLIATLRAALVEACDIADDLYLLPGDAQEQTFVLLSRIAALRSLAEEKP